MKNGFLVGTLLLATIGSAASVWAGGGSSTFSNADVKGTYSLKFSGFFDSAGNQFPTSSSFPQSGAGFEDADGNGNFTGALLVSIGGTTCSGNITGTYEVNPDGTGTSTATFTPEANPPKGIPAGNYVCPSKSGTQNEAFVIVSHDKIDFMSTDADSVVSGSAERQSRHGGEHH